LIPADEDGEFRVESPFTKINVWINYACIDKFIEEAGKVFKTETGLKTENWLVHDSKKEEYRFIASYEDLDNCSMGSSLIAKLDYNSKARAAKFTTINRVELGGNAMPDLDYFSFSEIEKVFSKAVDQYSL
jgi:hypothetical protein